MNKFLLISQKGELLPVAQRLVEEGATVEFLTTEKDSEHVGRGLIPVSSPINLLADDLKRGYLILNNSPTNNYAQYSNLGWRVLGNDNRLFPTTSFQMTRLLGVLKQQMPPTKFVNSLKETELNGIPYRISHGQIGEDVKIEGEQGTSWLKWQDSKTKGPFMIQEIPEGVELELAFWLVNGKLISPSLVGVTKDGQALAWSEDSQVYKDLIMPLCGELSGYTGPIWTTLLVVKQPRHVLLRTLSSKWPSYMWGAFLNLLQGELSSFLENVFWNETFTLDRNWVWIMPVVSPDKKLPFRSIADILGDCPVEGEAQLWDAYKKDEVTLTGGVSEMPITLSGRGDTPGAAQENAEERWMKLDCPFKTKAPSVMDQFVKTLDTLKAYNLCTKEA